MAGVVLLIVEHAVSIDDVAEEVTAAPSTLAWLRTTNNEVLPSEN